MPNDEQPPEPTAMQDTPRHVELSEKLAEHMKAQATITSLQSQLEAAEGENGRLVQGYAQACDQTVALAQALNCNTDDVYDNVVTLRSRAQQAEEMAGRAIAALELSAAPECSCQFQCQPNCPAMLYYAARKAALSFSPPSDCTDENQPTTKPQ